MKSIKSVIILFLLFAFTFCSSENEKQIFNEAKSLIASAKYDEAVVKFEEVVNKFPESGVADSSLFEIAKLYQGQVIKNVKPMESLNKAVDTYQIIFEKYPNSPLAESSIFMSAFILANEIKNFPKAEKNYKMYLEKYPNGDLADDAQMELKNLGKSPEDVLRNNNVL
ncbi:MAG: tetratricopeptide repeat protein [Ignavibacteriae bacterium]|nr:tetratricopeptide repeat protein [Ignavibacteriota bacterium]